MGKIVKDKYTNLENIVFEYIKKYKISVLSERFTTPVGRAWINTKEIKIPVIDSTEAFFVALHEVGHILTGQKIPETTPDFVFEYHADKWAIDTARKHGIVNEKYEMRARWYVLSFIADYHNKNENYIVPKKVLKFVGEDISSWEGFNVHIRYTSNEITIIKKLKSLKGIK